jgi:hypothetical protein
MSGVVMLSVMAPSPIAKSSSPSLTFEGDDWSFIKLTELEQFVAPLVNGFIRKCWTRKALSVNCKLACTRVNY